MANKIKRNFIFFFYFLYLVLQHNLVYLYHDDYGYACLKYNFNIGTVGMDFGMKEIFTFLKLHYLHWGGRVFYFFWEIVFLRYGGLAGIRIAQSLILTLITYEIYTIVKGKGKDSLLLAFTTVSMWGMLQITVLRQSVYWFTASSIYVWPIAPFLAGILIQQEIWRIRNYHLKNSLLFLLFFMAGFSQEQMALLTIGYCGLLCLFQVKKIQRMHLFSLAGALLGGAVEILAPGNFVRASGGENSQFIGMTLLEKITHNVPVILHLNFGMFSMLFVITLLIMMFLGSVVLRKQGKVGKWIFLFGVAGSSYPLMYLLRLRYSILAKPLNCLMSVWFLLTSIWLVLYCVYSYNYFLGALLGGVVTSQAMLAVVPALNYRSAIITQIPCMIVILTVFKEYVESINWNKRKICGAGIVYSIVIACYAFNVFQIGVGYYYNSRLNRANHRILSDAKEAVKEGEEIATLTLYKMHDDQYAEDMPYQKEYIAYWIKEYYELPQTVEFVYEDAWKYQEEYW